MKINVILDVDEKTILEESGQPSLTEAIGQELGWLRDSGMSVDHWSYLEQEKEISTPDKDALAIGDDDELIVRLSYYAGTLEASKLISPPEWNDLMDAIRECIVEYYDGKTHQQGTSIEEVARRVFLDAFPVDPSLREEKPTPSKYAGPDELVVRLAHLAGNLEAESHIGAADWDDLTVAIYKMVDAYMNDPSESVNPFCLEDAAERYFVIQFGLDEFREVAIAEGWSNMTPSELISDAKKSFRTVPDLSEEALLQVKDDGRKDYSREEDKILYRHKKTGELVFGDYYDKDDFLSVEGHLLDNPSDFLEVIGVYTSPECITAVHPCKISAIHEEIPADYQDDLGIDVLNSLEPEKLYDVCYYYTEAKDSSTLYTAVDRNLSAQEISANTAGNKYMEGAVIYESQRMLTVEEYIDGMRYNAAEQQQIRTTPSFKDVLNNAKDRAANQQNLPKDPQHQR